MFWKTCSDWNNVITVTVPCSNSFVCSDISSTRRMYNHSAGPLASPSCARHLVQHLTTSPVTSMWFSWWTHVQVAFGWGLGIGCVLPWCLMASLPCLSDPGAKGGRWDREGVPGLLVSTQLLWGHSTVLHCWALAAAWALGCLWGHLQLQVITTRHYPKLFLSLLLATGILTSLYTGCAELSMSQLSASHSSTGVLPPHTVLLKALCASSCPQSHGSPRADFQAQCSTALLLHMPWSESAWGR